MNYPPQALYDALRFCKIIGCFLSACAGLRQQL